MNLAALVQGDSVFVDANILAFHFQPHPVWGPACHQFLKRIENGDLTGFTSVAVLGELSHRLMTFEAHTMFGVALRRHRKPSPHPPARSQKAVCVSRSCRGDTAKQR